MCFLKLLIFPSKSVSLKAKNIIFQKNVEEALFKSTLLNDGLHVILGLSVHLPTNHPPYLNTVSGKNISLPTIGVLHMWLETSQICSTPKVEENIMYVANVRLKCVINTLNTLSYNVRM